MTTWSADQIRLFLDSEKDRREYALWHLAASTGMRRGELLGLPSSAVDFDNHRLSIAQTLVNLNNTPILTNAPKTDSSRRSVELGPKTVQDLRDQRRRTSEERLIAGAVWYDNDLVFCRADGSPEKPERITRVFGTRADAAGLPRISFHDLRHSWATLALGSGIPAKVVSEPHGHSSVLVTMDTYSHVTPGMDRQAAEQVAALFE